MDACRHEEISQHNYSNVVLVTGRGRGRHWQEENQLLIYLPSSVNTGTFYASCCFSIRNPKLSRKDSRGQQALLREAVSENKMEINTCLGQASSYI